MRPETVSALLKKRNAVIKSLQKKATSENPLPPTTLQQINDAYEFLKADLEDTYEAYRRLEENPHTNVRGIGLNCSPGCVLAIGICADGNDRWKNAMEDTHVFQDYFGNDPDKCFFAIYDGHHGQFAAEVAANELHHALLMEMEKFDPRTKCTCTFNMANNYDITQYDIHSLAPSRSSERGLIHEESTNMVQQIIRTCENHIEELEKLVEGQETEQKTKRKEKKQKKKSPFEEKIHSAFRKAHKYTDVLLSYGKDEESRVRWSGCSTLTCVIQSIDPQQEVEEDDPNKKVFGTDASAREGNKNLKSTIEPPREMGTIHMANAGKEP